MTNAYWLDLARRAVAYRGWRWMPGMRYRLSPRHPWCRYEGGDATDDDGNPVTESPPSARSALAVPDLSDPATLGCLLTLVREAYGRPDAYIAYQEAPEQRGWALVRAGRVLAVESTEAEALVAALEAAPAAGGAR